MPKFKIRKAKLSDAKDCARLHQQEINTGFLSQIGIKFLVTIYSTMINSQNACCFVAEDDKGKVTGFISGCLNTGRFYKEFLVKNGLKSFFIILPKMLRPVMLKRIFETLKYPSQSKDKKPEKIDEPKAELLSIAVNNHFRGTGASQALANALFDELKKMEIKELKVVVGESNLIANKFYRGLKFELYSTISVHGSEISNLYIKKL